MNLDTSRSSCETGPPIMKLLFSNPRIVGLLSRLLICVNGRIIIEENPKKLMGLNIRIR